MVRGGALESFDVKNNQIGELNRVGKRTRACMRCVCSVYVVGVPWRAGVGGVRVLPRGAQQVEGSRRGGAAQVEPV